MSIMRDSYEGTRFDLTEDAEERQSSYSGFRLVCRS